MKQQLKALSTDWGQTLLTAAAGVVIGLLVGAVDTLFGRVLIAIGDFRSAHVLWLLPFLAPAGLLIVCCYNRWGGKSGRGMTLIFQVGHGEEEKIPLRLIPFVMIGTWLTHLFGGSAGREGVAVQLGAAVSHTIGRHLPVKDASRVFLITGMAAGFAGLFQTPIAAVLFAAEVLVAGQLEVQALIPALTASFTASTTSHLLGLEKFTFDLQAQVQPGLQLAWKLAVLGIVFGIVGGIFAWLLKRGKALAAEKLKNPLLRVAVIGVFLTVVLLLLRMGRYSGLGTNLISASFSGGTIYWYDWALKLLLTVITLSAGYQGGEVTPLFSIGASLGVVLAGLLGLPVEFCAALGYAAVFGGATNTILAPVLIGAEVFGFEYLPCFFAVCIVGYAVNGGISIYGAQKKRSGI